MKIRKSQGASKNTYETELKGLSACPEKMKFQHANMLAMFTSDGKGETLSILDPTTKKQIVVPFEQIAELVGYARSIRNGEVQDEAG